MCAVAWIFPSYGLQPYCGSPPTPEALWTRWNFDPLLIISLVVVLAAYAAVSESSVFVRSPLARWRRLCFYGGWAIGAFALVSPLCALSVSLFAARVGQHMILAAVAAPLIAMGLAPFRAPRPFEAVAAAATFAAALWVWHAPGPYDATFRSPAVYWAMHVSTFGAALWLWLTLFGANRGRIGEAVLAAALTSLQMGLLGAILTFGGRALYAPHLLTTAAWGETPLADQQLGGVIMWIPAGLVLTVALLAGLARGLREADLHHSAARAAP
jgi:putative membrane protein